MFKDIVATAMCLVFALGMGIAPQALAAQPTAKRTVAKKRIVFHVTENNPDKWNMVLNNVANVQHDFGKNNVIIEIVTHGPGINMLKMESTVGSRLQAALENKVGLMACENTMRAAKVTKDDMYAGVSFVPSGVTHIIEREAAGWYYLRP